MTKHVFCDHCPGCRPALFDALTGKIFAPDHPAMIAANTVWDHETSYEERKAFIEVTVNNSRAPEDCKLATAVIQKMHARLSSRLS